MPCTLLQPLSYGSKTGQEKSYMIISTSDQDTFTVKIHLMCSRFKMFSHEHFVNAKSLRLKLKTLKLSCNQGPVVSKAFRA